MVPYSLSLFDPLRHLARRDLIPSKSAFKVIVKWSKTLQSRDSVRVIDIPSLGLSPLCPATALKVLLSVTPSGKNSPFFSD